MDSFKTCANSQHKTSTIFKTTSLLELMHFLTPTGPLRREPVTANIACHPWTRLVYHHHHHHHNNNDNNSIQRCSSRFFTISSLRRELSPTGMFKWPGRNHVQITCNTSSAYHVQHVVLCAMWYEKTAQLLSLTEFQSHLFELYFIGWTINQWRREETGVPREKPWRWASIYLSIFFFSSAFPGHARSSVPWVRRSPQSAAVSQPVPKAPCGHPLDWAMSGVSNRCRWGRTAGCDWGFEGLCRMDICLNGKFVQVYDLQEVQR